MSIFLLVYFSIYGGLHIYCFLKLKRALGFSIGAGAALTIFMLGMVMAPIVVRISEKHGFELMAQGIAYIGFTWMSILFLFVTVALALDIYSLILHIYQSILQADLSKINLSDRHSAFISLSLAVIITFYGAFEAIDIKTERVTIPTAKISKNIGRLRIVQISDVHLGLMVREKRLSNILERVKAAQPDILVSTGDLVDGQMDKLSGLADMLQQISAKYGKFAVTGNHEFYAGPDRSLDFIQKAGFTILRGESLNVAGLLNIAGVDDDTGKRYGLYRGNSETALLSKLPREKFTLFLKHRPVVDEDALGLFDLQLSGHTHKGQIFPFSLITYLYYPRHSGLLKLEKGSRLYVSRGSGTWGPPVRFLSAPEVTLIELVHKNSKQ